jgi:hypothetical protein
VYEIPTESGARNGIKVDEHLTKELPAAIGFRNARQGIDEELAEMHINRHSKKFLRVQGWANAA